MAILKNDYLNNFKVDNSLKSRISESKRICDKYKDRIPIIVNVYEKDINKLKLDKKKYLVPFELTIGQFLYIIRKRVVIEPTDALFLFFNNSLISNSTSLSSVYKSNVDEDGFLYATVSLENTFG
jgi:GABA(A) receptor-associated protein